MDKKVQVKYLNIKLDEFCQQTRHMTLAEKGALLELMISACQADGVLPTTEKELQLAAGATPMGWKKMSPRVMAAMELSPHGYTISHSSRATSQAKVIAQSCAVSRAAKSLKTNDPHLCNREEIRKKKEEIGKIDSKEDRPSSITSTSLEEILLPPAAEEKYFYENRLIKLNRKDFMRWKETFHTLDLRAELETLAVWEQLTPKNWFFATAAALKKTHETRVANKGMRPCLV